jgi:hypothetical protein
MYFIEGEENPKLQTNSEGSSKVAPDRLESTSEIIDGKLVWELCNLEFKIQVPHFNFFFHAVPLESQS